MPRSPRLPLCLDALFLRPGGPALTVLHAVPECTADARVRESAGVFQNELHATRGCVRRAVRTTTPQKQHELHKCGYPYVEVRRRVTDYSMKTSATASAAIAS